MLGGRKKKSKNKITQTFWKATEKIEKKDYYQDLEKQTVDMWQSISESDGSWKFESAFFVV